MPRHARVRTLRKATVAKDPLVQFRRWYRTACSNERPLPNAAALATATRSGRPSVRMVLLKDFDVRGFSFFTSYRSRKARELARNAHATLLFYWGSLERQVRITGRVVRLSPRESSDYFATRPRGSQLGAWASPQSAVLPGRAELERRFSAAARRFPDAVPRPANWGGYRLVATEIEFWQGRADRLHDRLLYRRSRGRWRMERLAP